MISKNFQSIIFIYTSLNYIFCYINYSKEKWYYKQSMDVAIKTTQSFHLFSFIRQYHFQMREERERERGRKPKENTILSFMIFAFKLVRDYCVNKSNLEYKNLDIRLTRITKEKRIEFSSYLPTWLKLKFSVWPYNLIKSITWSTVNVLLYL